MSVNGESGGSGAVAKANDFNRLRRFLENAKGQLQIAAAAHISPDRLIRFALTAASKNPALYTCTPESVGLSLLVASAFGLEPDGIYGHLVPYKNVCQFIPDYKGLVQLMYRCPRVQDVQANPVYENDEFEYEYGLNAALRHKPSSGDRGNLTHAWAMVRFTGGASTFVVMDRTDVIKRRNASRAAARGPWVDWEAAMWTKTAVRAVAKLVPMDNLARRAIEYDTRIESGNSINSVAELNSVMIEPVTSDPTDTPEMEGEISG